MMILLTNLILKTLLMDFTIDSFKEIGKREPI